MERVENIELLYLQMLYLLDQRRFTIEPNGQQNESLRRETMVLDKSEMTPKVIPVCIFVCFIYDLTLVALTEAWFRSRNDSTQLALNWTLPTNKKKKSFLLFILVNLILLTMGRKMEIIELKLMNDMLWPEFL